MAYTVKKLAELSGVSVRTLHWYDKLGLLKPAYHGINGYRFYEEEQLLRKESGKFDPQNLEVIPCFSPMCFINVVRTIQSLEKEVNKRSS